MEPDEKCDTVDFNEPLLPHHPTRTNHRVSHFIHWVCTIFLCILVGFLSVDVYYLRHRGKAYEWQNAAIYSPAQDRVFRKDVVFTSGFGGGRTIYQGPPSTEREAAWSNLYNFGISRIPKESAAKLVNHTVPIPDDPGYYIVSLNVFHQLHCLNQLRRRIYLDKADIDPTDELMEIEHIEHCVDAIRQSLMCSADITPISWHWNSTVRTAKAYAQVLHTCKDWEEITSWAREHQLKMMDFHVYVEDELLDS